MSVSLYGFIKQFNSESACLSYLIQLKHGLDFTCDKCGSNRVNILKSRYATLYCRDCKKQFFIAKDTIYEKSKISLLQWFIAAYLMSKDKRGISALKLARELDITYNPAYLMLTKYRQFMANRESMYKLEGLIDMDEFFILGSGGKAGRGTHKAKVIIALSFKHQDQQMSYGDLDDGEQDDEYQDVIDQAEFKKYPLYLKMRVVQDLTAHTINQFIMDSIEKDSVIRTDAYRGYNKILETGNTRIIEPSNVEVDNYRSIHLIITNLKAYINGTYHGVREENLQSYLDEFCYRFNRRKMHESLFDRLLKLGLSE